MSISESDIMERILSERGKLTLIKGETGYSMGIPDETSPIFRWQWFSGPHLGEILQSINKATEGIASA